MTDTGSGEPAASPPSAVAYQPAPGHVAQPGPGVQPAPVPRPPAGPGVAPPFPAPPTEGRTARLWFGIGVGALAVLLCCGGGVTALVGLGVVATRALNEQAQVVVGGYLDAVQDKRYDEAYGLLCEGVQDEESPTEFARRIGTEEPITTYDVGEVALAATDTVVPVEVVYGDGARDTLRVYLSQDRTTGEFEVCRVER